MEIEDFIEMNPAGKGQLVSPINHLLRIAAINGNFLEIAFELIVEHSDSIVCFAQLPYSVTEKPISMLRPGTSRLFELNMYPTTIVIKDDGSQKLLGPMYNGADSEGIQCTQIVGLVKRWGMRANWYAAYARMVTEAGLRESEIVSTENSWLKMHQPLNAAAYENDLARRLLQDFFIAIRRGLPEGWADTYKTLLSYFIMPYPGRVTFGNKPVPTLRFIQSSQPIYEKPKEGVGMQSVFLSYGGPDEAIAEAIRADLNKNGVNTWWFPKDARWGEKIHHEVKKNIRKYDRLLLLCSRKSLIRKGVLHELEEVFEREADEGGKAIVIPIALDKVLHEDWWIFEPDSLGEPIKGNLDPKELSRRHALATVLCHRVVGELYDAVPGDENWNEAINHLLEALVKAEEA